jgi:hypothetical protein
VRLACGALGRRALAARPRADSNGELCADGAQCVGGGVDEAYVCTRVGWPWPFARRRVGRPTRRLQIELHAAETEETRLVAKDSGGGLDAVRPRDEGTEGTHHVAAVGEDERLRDETSVEGGERSQVQSLLGGHAHTWA